MLWRKYNTGSGNAEAFPNIGARRHGKQQFEVRVPLAGRLRWLEMANVEYRAGSFRFRLQDGRHPHTDMESLLAEFAQVVGEHPVGAVEPDQAQQSGRIQRAAIEIEVNDGEAR